MAKVCRRPEILDEICFTEAMLIPIPPLLAPTLHLHTPQHYSSSCCSTKSHNCNVLSPSHQSSPTLHLLQHSTAQ